MTKVLVIAEDKLLCAADTLALLQEAEIASLALQVLSSHPLDAADNKVISVEMQPLSGFQWLGLRSLLTNLSAADMQLAGRGLQLVRWHNDHQFCGRCGGSTTAHDIDLAKTCHICAVDYYPRLSPCIIVLVTRGDECLLAWHTRSETEKYSCLAGFIEVGESAEQTLVREVNEEVGLDVANIRYVTSQSWPFPGQLMLGYLADFAAGSLNIDPVEIRAARWFRYDQLPSARPPMTTIAGQLIDLFIQQRSSLKNHNKS